MLFEVMKPCSKNYKKEMKEHPWATLEQAIRIDCDHQKKKKSKKR